MCGGQLMFRPTNADTFVDSRALHYCHASGFGFFIFFFYSLFRPRYINIDQVRGRCAHINNIIIIFVPRRRRYHCCNNTFKKYSLRNDRKSNLYYVIILCGYLMSCSCTCYDIIIIESNNILILPLVLYNIIIRYKLYKICA